MQNYFSSLCPLKDTSIKTLRSPKSETTVDSEIKESNLGKWSAEEHKMFICGIVKYGNDWGQVHKMVKTRTCIQLRSHSQKFFTKIKNMKIYENYKETLKNSQKLHEFCLRKENNYYAKDLIIKLIKKGDDFKYESYDEEEIFKLCKINFGSGLSLNLLENSNINKGNKHEYLELNDFIKFCDNAKFNLHLMNVKF